MHCAATLAARRWIATRAHSHLASPAASAAATASEAPMAAAVHKPRSWGTGKTLLLAAGGGLTAGSVVFGMRGEDALHSHLTAHRPSTDPTGCSSEPQNARATSCCPAQWFWVLCLGTGCAVLTCGPWVSQRYCCLAQCLMWNLDMGALGSVLGMLDRAKSDLSHWPPQAAHKVHAGEGLCAH